MMAQQKLIQELEQLNQLLVQLVKNWRMGNDQRGLQDFIKSIEQLDKIYNFQLNNLEEKSTALNLKELKEILENMLTRIKNNDLIGIADLIEFTLTPITQNWEKEVRKNEAGT